MQTAEEWFKEPCECHACMGLVEGVHVIRTCGECKYWAEKFILPPGLPPEAVKDLEGTHRECEHEDSPVMVSPIDFGCVYFKKKEI